MRILIMACKTLKDELQLAMKQTGVVYPVVYIESALHFQPDSLRRMIQEELDKIDNVDVVVMVFGYCGNGLMGIKSSQFKIVIPRVDDCISLLLGSASVRKEICQTMGTYFLTKGWLDHENNIFSEYERCLKRYGEKRTLGVMRAMLLHYRRFMVIETGAYPVDNIIPKTKDFATLLDMQLETTSGSLRLFRKLLLGEWDEEFIVLQPGQELTMDDICSGVCIQS